MPLPVDPFEIARNLGIIVKQEALDDNLAGFIVRENGGDVEIFLNMFDSHVRQRFTLAHELGHFFKNRDEQNIGYVDERSELASSGADSTEVWCNQFAAELLMPASIVKKYWAEGLSVDDLRSKFKVSGPAIEYRLKNLGLV
ncbi:ImmA/IrrE family metallo-endopeptidase [Mycolicibacterium sp. A43C]